MSTPIEDKGQTPPPAAGFRSSELPPLVIDKPPHVLIAGGGLAGLFLGILLERAGIPYEIFERTAEIKPLGNCTLTTFKAGAECVDTNSRCFITKARLLSSLLTYSFFARAPFSSYRSRYLPGKERAAPLSTIINSTVVL
jgi:hypothetical protein